MSIRTDLLVRVAVLYYEENITQTEIAKILNISRPTVASLLNEAKEKGIVKISVIHTNSDLLQKQEELKNKYSLKTLLIAAESSKDPKEEVGILCSRFMENRLETIKNLGICWGSTIYEYVLEANYRDYSNLNITPLIGGIGFTNFNIHSNHLAFMLSQKYNSSVQYFYAPAFADSYKQKEMFIHSDLVKQILEAGRKVDIAILGIGNPVVSSTFRLPGYLSDKEVDELEIRGAVGDIGATFFNSQGEPVQTSASERMIGISLEDIKKIPDIVVLATGKDKSTGVQALLGKKIIDHLIIDHALAECL